MEELKFSYKDVGTLRKYLDSAGRIKPSRETGLNEVEQRRMAKAVKQARHLALLPYSSRA